MYRRKGGKTIASTLSIAAAAEALGINPHYCKGLIHGMSIQPRRIGRMQVISGRDFVRLRSKVERENLAPPHNGRAPAATIA